MQQNETAIRGCLLGIAVGDAMGYAVDNKSWNEICEDYGPNGLLGYDLANGAAEITSYTQLAAFVSNGLLLATSRGKYDKLPRYLAMSLREWAKSQQFRGVAEKTYCWVAQVPYMRRRLCMDTRLLDALAREQLGTPEQPVFHSDSPSSLTAAVAVGLLFDPEKMRREQLCKLGANAVAFTHGDPEAYLSGAVLACAIAELLQHPDRPVGAVFLESAQFVEEQMPFTGIEAVIHSIETAISYAEDPELSPLAALSMLGCTTAVECLAGAIFCAAVHPGNFDEGMISAVNHSGRSCAVGALTGAILGAKLGAEALPEFYLESLEAAELLAELAEDVVRQRQLMNMFDDDWDQKYTYGMPVNG